MIVIRELKTMTFNERQEILRQSANQGAVLRSHEKGVVGAGILPKNDSLSP